MLLTIQGGLERSASLGPPMDLLALPEFDEPIEQRGIGIIAPFDLALERELWRWIPAEVSLHLARTHNDPVPVSRLTTELVSNTSHLAATRDVLHVEPEVVAYCAPRAA